MIRRLVIPLLGLQLLAACSTRQTEMVIPFAAVFGEQALACGAVGGVAELTDLRLYVADVQVISGNGDVVDVRLAADGQWQQADLALLDFEDGTGACVNGSPATNTTLRGSAPAREYRGLRFTVGVPFQRNHADPLRAAAPLGDPAMHWHWRAGYKFLRAGLRTANDGFWIHLGSSGCEGTVGNISGCRSPNRVAVFLEDFVPGRDAVVIDLATLITDSTFDDAVATDCSSGPAENSCAASFAALGLAFAGKKVIQGQRVFRVKDPR